VVVVVGAVDTAGVKTPAERKGAVAARLAVGWPLKAAARGCTPVREVAGVLTEVVLVVAATKKAQRAGLAEAALAADWTRYDGTRSTDGRGWPRQQRQATGARTQAHFMHRRKGTRWKGGLQKPSAGREVPSGRGEARAGSPFSDRSHHSSPPAHSGDPPPSS